jgi:hypothetical protein
MRRAALVLLTTSVLALAGACASGFGDGDGRDCGAPPTAWVLADDGGAAGLRAQLEAAGFAVEALPLDRSPFGLHGVVVIGSEAATDPRYADYMARYADDLYAFVDDANVLVQLDQDADVEPQPPFLPPTHQARRESGEFAAARVVADSPLLAGVREDDGHLALEGAPLTTRAFAEHGGFQVTLVDAAGDRPLLMEGAYGQGRLVLSSLALDRPAAGDPAREAFAQAFFANLREHTQDVCARDTEALFIDHELAAIPPTEGSAWIVALPDTQVYALRLPGLFDTQTAWIARTAETLHVAYVLHLGDIVNNNTELEWARARASMAALDGVVPYALVPGNHDYGPSGDASTRDTRLNDYFPFEQTAQLSSFGGAYREGELDNTYHLFSAVGRDFVVVALEWAPRDEVVAWANDVMDAHPDRLGILVTHAYLYNDDLRYDREDDRPQAFAPHDYDTPGAINDGQELWDKLVRHHPFVMTFNGHVLGDGTGYLASETDVGTTCHQMLSNYQMRELGGEAYLRLIELHPDGRTVIVRSYSPLLDRYLTTPDQQFVFTLDVD